MKVEQDFSFVSLQDHNGTAGSINYYNQQQHQHQQQQPQQSKYYTGYDSFDSVDENFYQQRSNPVTDDTSPPSNQQHFHSQPQPQQFQQPHRSFYQQQSYSQPELQHISRFNLSNQNINDFHIKEENEEEVTIESILDDDPLLSFTTTLDRQESNDTILQSSSPIKGPYDGPYDEVENLNLNHHNHSQASLVKHESPENTSITPPMNNFPTPANSTTSGVNSNQSPNNNSTGHFQIQQSHSQHFPQPFQVPYHPQQQHSQPQLLQQQQPFQPPQPQFITQYNDNNPSPTSGSPTDSQFVPVTAPPSNGNAIPTSGMVSMESTQQLATQQQHRQQQQPQLHQNQIPVQSFRMQIQNQAFFQPHFRNSQSNFQQPGIQSQPQPQSQSHPHTHPQQSAQPFIIQRPTVAPIQQQPPSLQHHHSTSSVQTIQTPITMKTQEMKLPPTPPPGREPPINKSSSTTKLNKVKKSSVSGPSTSTLKLKKSKSFLNSSPSMKDTKPFFTTLDFSKQLNPTHNTFINKDQKKFPKNGMKINVIKNYEFVLEPGHDKGSKNTNSSSSGISNKSTPRRPSNVSTPSSATSIKFPKLPKPPAIEKSSFSMYSPTHPNSSPTASDASGQSPLNSSQSYPFVNPSPIPSSIARFDNTADSSFNNGSSPITCDQIFFKPSSSSKRSSVSQTSPEKHPSPPPPSSFHRDMKSGLNEFKVRTTNK